MASKKKKKPKKVWKSLYKENWRLCHEIVTLRDGFACQIPGCGKKDKLDLDHVISRSCKSTFFETDILGYLCSEHHTHKSFRRNQWVDHMVRDICKERLGSDFEMHLFASRKPNPRFSTLMYQEEVNTRLKTELEELKRKCLNKPSQN